jgi:hypothetical protein
LQAWRDALLRLRLSAVAVAQFMLANKHADGDENWRENNGVSDEVGAARNVNTNAVVFAFGGGTMTFG